MTPLSLPISLTLNRALNQDHVTALRSLALVQGQTYGVNLSLFSGQTQVAPALSNFAFLLRNAGGANVVSATDVQQVGSGYSFSLPLVSPSIVPGSKYEGLFSFAANGQVEIIEAFPITIGAGSNGGMALPYVSSLNAASGDISLSGAGSVTVTTNGQQILIFGSAPTGAYYPLSNPSGFVTQSQLTGASGVLQTEIAALANASGGYYPRTNPSGFATTSFVNTIATGAVMLTGTQYIPGTKNFNAVELEGVPFSMRANRDGFLRLMFNGNIASMSSLDHANDETDRYSLGPSEAIVNGDVVFQNDNYHYYLLVDQNNANNQYGWYDLGSYAGAYVPHLNANPTTDQDGNTENVGVTINAIYPGSWTPNPDSFNYQWQRFDGSNWNDIGGETNSTYVTECADNGWQVRVKITATNSAGTSDPGYSQGTSVLNTGPTFTSNSTLAGSYNGTTTTTVELGSVTSCSDVTYTYAWETSSDNSTFTSAEHDSGGNTYNNSSDECGLWLRCVVTATDASGSTTDTTASVFLTDIPVNTSAPIIQDDQFNGTVGDSLSLATMGSWSTAISGFTISYQWWFNGSILSSETSTSLSNTSEYGSGSYWLEEIASNGFGSSSATSNSIFLS